MKPKKDVQPGTLALMVLKTLDLPLHGYGIARRIEQISGDRVLVNQGTLYPVLLSLEQEDAVESDWGPSENNSEGSLLSADLRRAQAPRNRKAGLGADCGHHGAMFQVKAEDLA